MNLSDNPAAKKFLDDLNGLLQSPETPAMGAYSMGVLTVLEGLFRRLPSRELLERASRCRTLRELDTFATQVAMEQRKRGRGKKPCGSVPLK